MMHDFQESLAASHAQADAPWWPEVYRQAFPGFASMHCVRKDGWAQRGGIDRVVVLQSGKTLSIDEKVRAVDYDDILLEAWSSREHKTPGWAWKDLACDFIAYAFVPSQRCYLLPFVTLRRVVVLHGKSWWDLAQARTGGFRLVEADNRTYTTVSIAVPTELLMGALEDAMLVRWEPAHA